VGVGEQPHAQLVVSDLVSQCGAGALITAFTVPVGEFTPLLGRWCDGVGADSCYGLLGGALWCWLSGWWSTPEGSSTPVRTAPTTKMDPDTRNAVV